MPFGSRVLSLVVFIAALLGAIPAGAAQAAPKQTRIAVSVAGLPPGLSGNVTVRGPKVSRTIKRTTTLRVARAGTYTFTVRQIKIRSGRKRVKSGSLIVPTQAKVRIKVKAGKTTKVKLRYGTIINANVKGLSFAGVKFSGDPLSPTTLTLPAKSGVKVGAILTGRPTAKLPAGVFHRVTKVRRSGKNLVVTLKPAHLQEAFPQLDISSKLKFAPGKVTVGAATTSAFDPLTASLGTSNFRCTASLGDSYIKAGYDFDLDAVVEIHIPTVWGIPTGAPYGVLSTTFSGSAALDVMLRKNTGCTGQVAAPAISGAIPVGPVLVPTYVQFGLFATASIGTDIRLGRQRRLLADGGHGLQGHHVVNLSKASAYADAYVGGSGKFSFGPSVRFAVGAAKLADVHFDAKPALAFSAFLDLSCSIDIVGGSQVGISFGPFQINQPLPAP